MAAIHPRAELTHPLAEAGSRGSAKQLTLSVDKDETDGHEDWSLAQKVVKA
jgi:hypothetical protein